MAKKWLVTAAVTGAILLVVAVGAAYLNSWRMKNGLAGGAVGLVADFPKISVYPRARLLNSSANEQGMLFRARWETNDSVPAVMAWYARELPRMGWQINTPPADSRAEAVQLLMARNEAGAAVDLSLSVIKNLTTGKTEIVAEFPLYLFGGQEDN